MTAILSKKNPFDPKEILKTRIESAAFRAWIEPLDFSDRTLFATSRFNADFIRATFGHIFSELGVAVAVRAPDIRAGLSPINDNGPEAAATGRAAPKRDDFEDFICGAANQFALAAVRKCARGGAELSPLVIYGPTGSGKTMLLDLLEKNTDQGVVRMTGASFVSDFIRSMKSGASFLWKDQMRACGLFIMDDIQGLAGKRASAEEFLSLLDDLVRMKRTIVLTSNIAPSRITGFDGRQLSLLSSGLSVDLAAPDAAARRRILARAGLPEDLAENLPANGHIISGVIKKVSAWRELYPGDLSDDVLEKLLGDVLEKQKSPAAMVKNMCAKLGVAFDDVMSSTRTKAIVFARQKIMAALKRSTNLTLSDIGRLVGGRDHASVLYALSQIDKAKQADMLLESEIVGLASD